MTVVAIAARIDIDDLPNLARADDLDEATAALAQYGPEARILAGGQSLIAMLNMRLAEPKLLIDISRAQTANYVRRANGHSALSDFGASCRALQRHCGAVLHCPALPVLISRS